MMLQKTAMRSPWLLKLLLAFIFFFPFRSVQIPIRVLGFELNPARIAIALATVLLGLNLAVDFRTIRFFHDRAGQRNPFVFYLFVYFLLSIAYFYLLVSLGKVVYVSGGGELFFRSSFWRPFVQLLSFSTYGLIPYILVQYFARDERLRARIERVFLWAVGLLVGYAYVQILAYIFLGSPLTGRQFFESVLDLGYVSIFGIPFYRVNSLAAEPRDFGSLLVGALPFYLALRSGRLDRFGLLAILLTLFVLLLTTSTSALLTAVLTLVVIFFDQLGHTRVRIRVKHLRVAAATAVLAVFAFFSQIVEALSSRTRMILHAILDQLATGQAQPIAQDQTFNLIIVYYLLNLFDVAPLQLLVGAGYSNFITPLAGLLKQYFSYTVDDAGILTPDSFAIKLFIEGGIVGLAIYGLMFFYTLKLNSRLLGLFRTRQDWNAYRKALWLRFSFIAFFISGAVQISYYYFIVMGLIVGWLNGELKKATQTV